MAELLYRLVTRAVAAGDLSEVVRLCWRDLESGKFCSDQVQCLASVLQYFDDQDGLVLLRQGVGERVLRDTHYGLPVKDSRDDLMERVRLGIEWCLFLRQVEVHIRLHPGITRRRLYECYKVFDNSTAKRAADREKPKELRSEDWFYPPFFESRLCLFNSIERILPQRFRTVRSAGPGLDKPLSLHTFNKVNLRPTTPPLAHLR